MCFRRAGGTDVLEGLWGATVSVGGGVHSLKQESEVGMQEAVPRGRHPICVQNQSSFLPSFTPGTHYLQHHSRTVGLVVS